MFLQLVAEYALDANGPNAPFGLQIFSALICYTAMFLGSRTRHWQKVGYFFVTYLMVTIFMVSISIDKSSGFDPNLIYLALIYLVLGVLISGVLYPPRTTLLFGTFAVVITISVPMIKGNDMALYASVAVYIIAASGLAIVGADIQKSFVQRAEAVEFDIKNLFDNMQQAVIMIDQRGIILPGYSQYSLHILDSNLQGKNFVNDILVHADLSKDDLSQVSSAILSIVGESFIAFHGNCHLLPSEVRFSNPQRIAFDPY